MPMYGSGYIFSKPFFTGWVTVGIIWIFCSFFGVGLFPLFEGRKTLVNTFKYVFKDISGKSHPKTIHAQEAAEKTTPGDATPPEKAAVKAEISAT
jgi:urea-proton symporter